jgi:thiamine kinase-like enzyme
MTLGVDKRFSEPPDWEEQVRAELRRMPGLPQAGAPWSIDRLPSQTNRTFRVAHAGDAYVLRLPGRGTARYIDRWGEAANARAAAAAGLAPEIVFADPSRGVMLSRYVAGADPLSPGRLRDPRHLKFTVELLRRLHDSGLAFQGEMRLYDKLDEYLGLAGEHPRAGALRGLREAGEGLRPILAPGFGPIRPCHIDPGPANVIVAPGRHFLVDWEYSAMCEPLWDLAGLSIEGDFDPPMDQAMLGIYYGAGQPWGSRLHLYKIMLRLLAAAWGVVQLVDGNGDGDDVDGALVDRYARRAAADLGSAELARHVAAAA